MKRFRIYQQENGRLHKVKGRYRGITSQVILIDVKSCGYDTLNEAQEVIKIINMFYPSQYCVIDFKNKGLIVSINNIRSL